MCGDVGGVCVSGIRGRAAAVGARKVAKRHKSQRAQGASLPGTNSKKQITPYRLYIVNVVGR